MIFGSEEFNDLLALILKEGGYRHPGYMESVEHAEEMSWHFYGVTPTELLRRARPNEDEEITEYRIENYEPHTKAAADKSVNITSKIFNPNLYSIRWGKDKDSKNAQDLKSYLLDYYPKCNSVVNYTKDVLLRKMLSDPNAVIAIKPDDIPYGQQSVTIEPVPVIYGSSHVYNYDEEHYLIFIEDKIIDKTKFQVFEYYDKDRYIRFAAALKKNIVVFSESEYDEFNYGFAIEEPPVWHLQGMIEAKDDGNYIYKSFFYSAAPFWNDAITHESDLKGSFIRHLFPQKYELTEVCSYRHDFEGQMFPCKSGKIRYGSVKDDKSQIITCPHCNGTGWEPIGPYGVYKYTKDKLQDSGPLGVDPVGYINVPVDATKMLDERVDKLMKKGMWAINMDVEDEVGEVQSGAAKVIDRSSQYDMLYNIGSVVFDVHIENIIYYTNKFMFGVESKSLDKKDDDNLPQINKPTQFDILTTAELINNYKIGKDSGLDANFLVTKEQEIFSKDLTTNPDLKLFNLTLLDLDPLAGMAEMTVRSNVMAGFNSKADAVIHFNIRAFVERALQENKTFMEMQKPEKIAILQAYAKEFISANKVTLDPNMQPTL